MVQNSMQIRGSGGSILDAIQHPSCTGNIFNDIDLIADNESFNFIARLYPDCLSLAGGQRYRAFAANSQHGISSLAVY